MYYQNISARGAVNIYCTGGFVMGFSSASDTKGDRDMHRRRLATLFTILGVEEGDPMIALTREINPRFTYPITLEEPQGYLRPETLIWVRNLSMV